MERHNLYLKWAETVTTSSKRDQAMTKLSDVYELLEKQLDKKSIEHKVSLENLKRNKDDNKQKETENYVLER